METSVTAHLHHAFQLVDAEAQIEHVGLVHVSHAEVSHERDECGERFFLGHL